MRNLHLNSVAEEAVERDYFRKGYMGTESATCSFRITENDLDVISEEGFTLEAYNQELEFEVNVGEMVVYFGYSEEK